MKTILVRVVVSLQRPLFISKLALKMKTKILVSSLLPVLTVEVASRALGQAAEVASTVCRAASHCADQWFML